MAIQQYHIPTQCVSDLKGLLLRQQQQKQLDMTSASLPTQSIYNSMFGGSSFTTQSPTLEQSPSSDSPSLTPKVNATGSLSILNLIKSNNSAPSTANGTTGMTVGKISNPPSESTKSAIDLLKTAVNVDTTPIAISPSASLMNISQSQSTTSTSMSAVKTPIGMKSLITAHERRHVADQAPVDYDVSVNVDDSVFVGTHTEENGEGDETSQTWRSYTTSTNNNAQDRHLSEDWDNAVNLTSANTLPPIDVSQTGKNKTMTGKGKTDSSSSDIAMLMKAIESLQTNMLTLTAEQRKSHTELKTSIQQATSSAVAIANNSNNSAAGSTGSSNKKQDEKYLLVMEQIIAKSMKTLEMNLKKTLSEDIDAAITNKLSTYQNALTSHLKVSLAENMIETLANKGYINTTTATTASSESSSATAAVLKSYSDQLRSDVLTDIAKKLPELVNKNINDQLKPQLSSAFRHSFESTLLPSFQVSLLYIFIIITVYVYYDMCDL